MKQLREIEVEPIIYDWKNIAPLLGIEVKEAPSKYDVLMKGGYIIRRRPQFDPQHWHVATFQSFIDIYLYHTEGRELPPPRPDILLVGVKEIMKGLHMCERAVYHWLPTMSDYGLCMMRLYSRSKAWSAFESQCKAFLVIIQGGRPGTKPKGPWENVCRGRSRYIERYRSEA